MAEIPTILSFNFFNRFGLAYDNITAPHGLLHGFLQSVAVSWSFFSVKPIVGWDQFNRPSRLVSAWEFKRNPWISPTESKLEDHDYGDIMGMFGYLLSIQCKEAGQNDGVVSFPTMWKTMRVCPKNVDTTKRKCLCRTWGWTVGSFGFHNLRQPNFFEYRASLGLI